ncbi:hypothetical protein DICVIV_04396 [Dictyocaulus viviparus]|uniref:Uncharacterized protein n=1 Tax=Dictyocaulus viviparus TaxID=29172 RepID=A0A0D8Y0A5_DICVI|nr:hypothetical protein DICVIV_04396 [Dictyocaulus viviparus]
MKDLIYKKALPVSNNQIRDVVWWVPSGESYQATKVTVMEARKRYTTYSFRLILQKSQCDFSRTSAVSLRHCKPIPSSKKRLSSQLQIDRDNLICRLYTFLRLLFSIRSL